MTNLTIRILRTYILTIRSPKELCYVNAQTAQCKRGVGAVCLSLFAVAIKIADSLALASLLRKSTL